MMKLKLALLFSMLAMVTHAQEEMLPEKRVRLGLKVGFNASAFTREVAPFDGQRSVKYEDYQSNYRTAGLGGITAQLILSKHFTFGAEALFNARGMAYRQPNYRVVIVDDEGNESFAFNNFNYNIDYVEFPVMIYYGFKPPAYKTLISTYVGLAPATVINRQIKLRYEQGTNGSKSKGRFEKSTLNSVNPFNTSLLAGVQIAGDNSSTINLFGDLMFSHTLRPVFERNLTPEGRNLKTHMVTGSLSFGVRF